MVAEGISMLNSKRSEFESILRQEGIDSVIALMRDKIGKPVELNQDESYGIDGPAEGPFFRSQTPVKLVYMGTSTITHCQKTFGYA